MAVFDPTAGKPALPHGGTFSANPVTMRAGIAAMELLDEAEFARLDALGKALREGLRKALSDEGLPGCVTGRRVAVHASIWSTVRSGITAARISHRTKRHCWPACTRPFWTTGSWPQIPG